MRIGYNVNTIIKPYNMLEKEDLKQIKIIFNKVLDSKLHQKLDPNDRSLVSIEERLGKIEDDLIGIKITLSRIIQIKVKRLQTVQS